MSGSRERAEGQALDDLLRAARRTWVRARWLEGALVLAAGFGFTLIIGTFAASAGLRAGWIALLEVVGLVLTAAVAVILARRAGPSDAYGVATWLDQTSGASAGNPSLRSAVELLRDRGRYGESPELATAAVRAALDAARRRDALGAARQATFRRIRLFAAPAAVAGLATAGAFVVAPDSLEGALAAFSAVDEIDEALERVPPPPRLGDIEVTLRYPGYTERPPRRFTSPSGRIVALPGTEVSIRTRSRVPVREASLIVSSGDAGADEGQRIAVDAQGRDLTAKLVVSRAGRYRFRLTTDRGELQEERTGHDIELELDEVPEVTLLEPTESPLEVNKNERVNLSFKAKDDYALGESTLYWRVLGTAREGRVKLTSASSGTKRYTGTAQVDLVQLDVKPGDRVAYTVEVRDNDTVSGPKVGQSATQELRIYSERAHHEQVLALQEKCLDELVHILGDNLDFAFERAEAAPVYKTLLTQAQRIVERAEKANQLLVDTVAAIRKDPLGRPQVADAFEQARVQLKRDARRKGQAVRAASKSFARTSEPSTRAGRRVKRRQDRMVQDLEKNVVYLADLLNDQRLIDAEALAKELRKEQEALREALKEYKDAPTEEKRRLIAQAIQDIKQRIQDIMKQMAKLQSKIPQDFVNRDALDTQDAQSQMEEVEKMIEQGDLDAAMESLDQMLNQTERMLSQLEEGREELGSREYSEITEKAEKLWQDLEALEADQKKLADRTESMSREMMKRVEERLGDPDAFVKKQLARLEKAQAKMAESRPGQFMPDVDLHELTERRLEDGKRALQSQDFGAAKEVLEKAARQIGQLESEARRRGDRARRFGDVFGDPGETKARRRSLGEARPEVESVLEDIEKLTPDPESLLSPDEKKQMSKLGQQQAQLQKRAEQLGKDLDSLGEQLPIVGPEMKANLDGAQGSMGEASQRLGGGDAPGALGQEREALDKLRQLKQELQKMGEQGGGGGQQGGVPLPFGNPGRQQGGEGGEGGRDPRSREKVEIPQADQYKAPAEFREDILEAAKQGTVEAYKDAVQEYYEELVK